MKAVLIFALFLATSSSFPQNFDPEAAEKCTSDVCSMANNCRCASAKSPLEGDEEAPQLIVLTFSIPIQNGTYNDYLEPLLAGRVNPDGNPIGGTFFIAHEFTDYKRVQDLWLMGFEIGVNSISNNNLQDYWRTADVDTLKDEFGGQKTILKTFAKIPDEDIVGARTPLLAFNGDNTMQALADSGLQYDNSWTSRSTSALFPYTLDFLSTQECPGGLSCPSESHPGFWVAPIINLQGEGGIECNFLSSCLVEGSPEDIRDWLLAQVDRISSGNKAPLSILVVPAWFTISDNHYEGFTQFLDALSGMNNVFLVSQKQAIDWVKNPVPLSQFQTATEERTADCENPVYCKFETDDGNVRYMNSCTSCPKNYPWLGDPMGNGGVTTTSPDTPPTDTTTTSEGPTETTEGPSTTET